jgi:hypothetical protein
MGSIFHPACKVFGLMPARKLIWNFEKIFGGVSSYIKWSILVVVVIKMELKCKNPFCI